MLDEVRGIHDGKTFAVIGSAPSATIFSESQDFTIGVNGAGELLREGDYFLSADEIAHSRSWFRNLEEGVIRVLRPCSAIYSEVMFPDQKVREEFVGKLETYMDENPEEVKIKRSESDELRILLPEPFLNNVFDLEVPEPDFPHYLIRGIVPDETVSREQTRLNYGGTSACVAMQLAHVMGASEIHLFGVEFSNDVQQRTDDNRQNTYDGRRYEGKNYFYTPRKHETGMTTPGQRERMDEMIIDIFNQGTRVISHGPTALQNSEKVGR